MRTIHTIGGQQVILLAGKYKCFNPRCPAVQAIIKKRHPNKDLDYQAMTETSARGLLAQNGGSQFSVHTMEYTSRLSGACQRESGLHAGHCANCALDISLYSARSSRLRLRKG